MTSKPFLQTRTRKSFRLLLLLLSVVLVFGALYLPLAIRPESLPIQIGAVASRDIVAPENDAYISSVLTEKAKSDAANSVAAKYLPSDPFINRTQIEKLQNILAYITSVRNDKFADQNQKIEDLANIANAPISSEEAAALLALNTDQWESIKKETLNVLDQTMRRTIRDTQIQESLNNIPGLINYSIPADQSKLIEILVSPFVTANALYSEQETLSARKQASDLIAPVSKIYSKNEAIVLHGQIVTAEQFEALDYFGLIRPEQKLQDLISTISLITALTSFIILYFSRRKISSISDLRNLTVISLCFIVFLYAARIIIPNRSIVPYFFPLPAFALILVTLFNLEISISFSLILSILAAYGFTNSIDITIFYIVTSLVGTLALGRGKKAINFLYAGIAIAFAGILIITAYRLTNPFTDLIGLFTLYGATFLNGFASASLALLLQFLLSQLLGLPTPMHLIEISRSDNPLLKRILQFAPGTYQHSLQVSNLAEQAAESIGADALLTRVGSLFHDAGKSTNPTFFIENQVPGSLDSHDDMDPIIAAQTIIQHVHNGVALAEKFHLPPRLQDFIREHHGTQVTRYQYNRAVEQQNKDVEKVDIELFRYPGPKPQTKETGILMLADGCEARARAERPKNEEDLRIIIKKVFDYIFSEGLLENTNLTLRDLKIIQESFFYTLSKTYHPRILYPEPQTIEAEEKPQF